MRVALSQGAYTSKSIISDAQSCYNLYQEKNPEDSPFPLTHYLTPGIDQLSTGTSLSNVNAVRCTFRTSHGDLYVCIGSTIYYVDPAFVFTSLGTIGTFVTPVSMQDNGLVILICDGSANLYAIDISSGAPGTFGIVTDPNIYGGDRVDYIDTFFVLNVPGTNEWYVSLSEINYAMLTGVVGAILSGSVSDTGDIGAILTGTISNTGSAYTDGTYTATPLTGGTGTGAIATIVVSGGVVTSVTITSPGINYSVGDILTAIVPGGSGFAYTVATTGGTYTDGTYTVVPLTGGSGSGAQATIVIASQSIASVTITTPGTGYAVGDVLSASDASIGGTGSGFTYLVETIGGGAFDPLDIATKNGYPDPIQALIVMHREIWIIGQLTTEIWYNAGAADFVFQILPGTFVEHGCIAKYSICKQDLAVYWLSQDEQGQAIVIKGSSYQAKRISTFAIENALSGYNTVSDCIGFAYQQEGHTFVVFSFPSQNVTWVYDETMQLWHQRAWTDNNGVLNRHRMNLGCNAYNTNIVGDWQNGNLYKLNLTTYTDNVDGLGENTDGSYPISRIRSFPAMINEGKRVTFKNFTADMEVGTSTYPSTLPPMVSLRYSDDRGRTYGNKLEQSLGAQGDYLTQPNWWRLGQSRGRVFELSWSIGGATALNGAWVDVEPAGT